MSDAPRRVYLVSHTHWDREWYLSLAEFRVMLARVVGEVLERLEEGGEFRHFLLDGQAIVLEDHLAAHPEDRERISRQVAAGRLAVGPWYVLPDEFLVSDEALIRNLLVGHRVAGVHGAVQKVGYLPDTFGHVAQMPQLLRLAGIDSFVYTRGDGDELESLGLEHLWRAPDGSEVLAIHQLGGYCNAGGLGHAEIWHAHTRRAISTERAVEQVRSLFARMRPLARTGLYLLNNGCDHFPPQRDFPRVLAALRAAFPATEFLHAGLGEYLADLRAEIARADAPLPARTGDLLGARHHPILTGVWSARMPLKIANDACQRILASALEPVCAYARFAHGRTYPEGLIREAWKRLLENHPHDSICGCSTDEVHRAMPPRFNEVRAAAEQMLKQEIDALAPAFGEREQQDREIALAVVNPLPRRRSEVIDRLVVVAPGVHDPRRLELRDEAGRFVRYEVLESRRVERFWGIDYRGELAARAQREKFAVYREHFAQRMSRPEEEAATTDLFLTIRFLAEDLPPLGHRIYTLREAEAGARTDETAATGAGDAVSGEALRVGGDTIDNGICLLRLHPDGTLDLLDRRRGNRFEGLNLLEDGEEIGDEYDHGELPAPTIVTAAGCAGTVRVIDATALRATLEAAFEFELPAGIDPGRDARGRERVACPVRVRATLAIGSPLVELEVDFENRARDHRLRALFPAGVLADSLWTDGHFLVSERPAAPPAGENWVQRPAGTLPQQAFALVQEPGRGLAVIVEGLPEVAPLRGDPVPREGLSEGGAGAMRATRGNGELGLAVTLLRCVGWLSRDDFGQRPLNAGPTLFTPEAQCIGPQRFRYALLPFGGDWLAEDVKGASVRYRTPVLVRQGVAALARPGGEGLIEQRGLRTCITAIKRHEARETLVVRLYNLASTPSREQLVFGRPVAGAWRVDLLEERIGALALAPGSARELALELRPHEIVTIEVAFAGEPG